MIRQFKTLAFWEGVSLLALLFFAMPLKYWAKMPIFVTIIGSLHGFLFIAYIIFATFLKFHSKWSIKKWCIVCLASIIPFGTFYIERNQLRDELAG